MYNIPSETLEKWLEIFELKQFKNLMPAELSTGMKRKLCFIICSISNPQYKFLDEPTSGVDPVTRLTFQQAIDAQKISYGSSSIFTTHTMDEAENVCDKVVILVNGQISAIESPDNLRAYSDGYILTIDKKRSKETVKDIQLKIKSIVPEVEASEVEIEEIGSL